MSLFVEIEKQLGNFHLDVRFQAETETLALLGASGCGKSMTLKCIAGIMTPDRGRIVLNGRVLFDSEARIDLPPQQRRVGYLFQNYALFPTMTVEKNILCGIRSGSKAEKAAALSATLHRFRLEGLEKRYPAQLSGGQQQRVALARILCSQPEVILLDEPFSALDSYLKWDLELKLSDFWRISPDRFYGCPMTGVRCSATASGCAYWIRGPRKEPSLCGSCFTSQKRRLPPDSPGVKTSWRPYRQAAP